MDSNSRLSSITPRAIAFVKPVRAVTRVFLHCSASDHEYDDDISVIKQWHLARGFSDVGYHYFVRRDGVIQFGRSLEATPAAQQWNNRGTIAICAHGNAVFPDVELEAVRALCQAINKAYAGRVTFHGHREVNKNKTCPVYDYKRLLGLDANGRMPL